MTAPAGAHWMGAPPVAHSSLWQRRRLGAATAPAEAHWVGAPPVAHSQRRRPGHAALRYPAAPPERRQVSWWSATRPARRPPLGAGAAPAAGPTIFYKGCGFHVESGGPQYSEISSVTPTPQPPAMATSPSKQLPGCVPGPRRKGVSLASAPGGRRRLCYTVAFAVHEPCWPYLWRPSLSPPFYPRNRASAAATTSPKVRDRS